MKTITSQNPIGWIYEQPPDSSAKCFLLTEGGIATVGRWGDGIGLMAYCPMPKRDRKAEARLNGD